MALNFFKQEKQDQVKEVPKRIKKMSTDSLLSWVETTTMYVGQSFDAYRYHDAPLEDLRAAVETLSQMVEELSLRSV